MLPLLLVAAFCSATAGVSVLAACFRGRGGDARSRHQRLCSSCPRPPDRRPRLLLELPDDALGAVLGFLARDARSAARRTSWRLRSVALPGRARPRVRARLCFAPEHPPGRIAVAGSQRSDTGTPIDVVLDMAACRCGHACTRYRWETSHRLRMLCLHVGNAASRVLAVAVVGAPCPDAVLHAARAAFPLACIRFAHAGADGTTERVVPRRGRTRGAAGVSTRPVFVVWARVPAAPGGAPVDGAFGAAVDAAVQRAFGSDDTPPRADLVVAEVSDVSAAVPLPSAAVPTAAAVLTSSACDAGSQTWRRAWARCVVVHTLHDAAAVPDTVRDVVLAVGKTVWGCFCSEQPVGLLGTSAVAGRARDRLTGVLVAALPGALGFLFGRTAADSADPSEPAPVFPGVRDLVLQVSDSGRCDACELVPLVTACPGLATLTTPLCMGVALAVERLRAAWPGWAAVVDVDIRGHCVPCAERHGADSVIAAWLRMETRGLVRVVRLHLCAQSGVGAAGVLALASTGRGVRGDVVLAPVEAHRRRSRPVVDPSAVRALRARHPDLFVGTEQQGRRASRGAGASALAPVTGAWLQLRSEDRPRSPW